MTDTTPVFDFAAAKKVREQQEKFEAAKVELKDVQREFLKGDSLDAFRAKLKEATGGRAKEYLYLKVVASDGSECCAYIKGNAQVGNNGSIPVTLGFWETNETVNIAQVLEFYPGEDGAYTEQWQAESDAYDKAEAEEAARVEQERADKEAAKLLAKQQRQQEKDAAKGKPAGEAGDEAKTGDEANAGAEAGAAAPAAGAASTQAAAPAAGVTDAPKGDAPKADAAQATGSTKLGDNIPADVKNALNGGKPAHDARTAPRGPGAAGAPGAPAGQAAKA